MESYYYETRVGVTLYASSPEQADLEAAKLLGLAEEAVAKGNGEFEVLDPLTCEY